MKPRKPPPGAVSEQRARIAAADLDAGCAALPAL